MKLKGGPALALVVVVFAAAGACSPILRRRYDLLSHPRLGRDARRYALPPPRDSAFGDGDADIGGARYRRRDALLAAAMAAAAARGIDLSKLRGGPFLGRAARSDASDKQLLAAMSKYESSPEWQAALIKLLEEMKAQGVDVDEVEANGPLNALQLPANVKVASNGDPLVCKTIPYNVCYKLNKDGSLSPLAEKRPLRILRVYKRNSGGLVEATSGGQE